MEGEQGKSEERQRERDRCALRAFRHGDEAREPAARARARGQWLRYPQVQGNRAGPIRHRVVFVSAGETEQVTRLPPRENAG